MSKQINALVTIALVASFAAHSEGQSEAQKAADTCFSSLYVSPEALFFMAKLPIDINKSSSLEILSNKSTLSKAEKPKLLNFVSQWENCVSLANEYRKSAVPPDMVAVYQKYWLDTKTLFADLYAGTATFADVAKTRIPMEQEYGTRLQILASSYQAQAERQQQIQRQQEARVEANRQQLETEKEAYSRQQIAENQRLDLAQKVQKQRENEAQVNLGMQLLQMAQPRPMPNLLNKSISCRSGTFGNVTNTNCN